jgi:D-alanyl-D-alanine carboxypeptidase (penicillin-binding protein 5/6)
MTDFGVLQEGRVRRSAREARRRRRRRHRRIGGALGVVVLGAIVLLVFMAPRASGPPSMPGPPRSGESGHGRAANSGGSAGGGSADRPLSPQFAYGVTPAPAPERISAHLKLKLSAGLLFDVRSGRVLWSREAGRELPIASLTKMMTALVVVARSRPGARVLVTRQAVDFSGSGVGLLPLGKRVTVRDLLYGLLLPSGNDAAIALAQHVAGTQVRFVAMMNERAQAMGLRCTHFTTVSGIVDQGNRSCPSDLAVLAHAVLDQPELGRIVGTSSAVLRFPIKGGKLYLYNNNPLLRLGFPGTDGVKTGYTVAAGECLVATARRGRRWLGVVLLHSQDPPSQAMELLSSGFATRG